MGYLTRDGRAYEPEYLLSISPETCIGCGRCFKVCGLGVMELRGYSEDSGYIDLEDEDEEDDIEKRVMALSDAGACIGCGACARVCPTNAQVHGAPE